jgi:crotonobetainyl-CoA:carnitine CoA-transferase CaiB-like acyl-CoA transferase
MNPADVGGSSGRRTGLGAPPASDFLRSSLAAMWQPSNGPGALNGVRVVDLGQYVAGPLAATLLADQGAEVVRIEPPDGPRWESPANAMLLRRRRTVTLDLHEPGDRARAQALIASADVVIENFRPGVAERLGVGPTLCSVVPQLVYCSLPGFGSDDPRAGLPAWEGVVLAAAGAYSLDVSSALIPGADGPPDRPAFSPLALASVFGASEGAMAICAALIARERDGFGQRIEVPLFDALFEAIGLRGLSYERNGPFYTDMGSGFFRCSDGKFIVFVATWFRHLEWFARGAGVGAWIDEGLVDYDRLMSDPDAVAELRRRLIELFATRPAPEWEQLLRDHGCTVSMLRSTTEWLAEPQATASGTFADVRDPVLGPVRVPGTAVRLHGFPSARIPERADPSARGDSILEQIDAARSGIDLEVAADADTPAGDHVSATAPPLAGINVLDLSRVVAAPTAAKLLGQLGADVVKIDEDPLEARASTPMPSFHEHLNRAKHSIALDLADEADIATFGSLLGQADVLVENFTLGVAERLGFDHESLRRDGRAIVSLHLNTYGREGPWAVHRGYAELANVSTGLTERTIGDDLPDSGASASADLPRWTYTDYAAGVLGAFGVLAALYERQHSGEGRLVEASLVRATTLEQLLYVVATVDDAGRLQSRVDAASEPRGREPRGWNALQCVYPTADGAIYLGARAGQLPALADALDAELPVSDDELLDALTELISTQTTDEVVERLEGSDVGVHTVTSVGEIMSPGNVADQRHLRLEEQSEEFGTVVMPGPVVRFGRTPMMPGRLPGPFGADRDRILSYAREGGWR